MTTTNEIRHARHAQPQRARSLTHAPTGVPYYEHATTILGHVVRLDPTVPRHVIGLEQGGVIVGVLLQRAGPVQPERGPLTTSASAAL